MPYTVKLLDKKEIAEGTMAFTFEKPEGYSFEPGQATDWNLIDPKETDAAGTGRSFSLSSAPEDPFVRFATRMRDSAFKRAIRVMPIGGAIQMDDPWGDFVLKEDTEPAVFIGGGIGITPFISMARHAANTMTAKPLVCFFSNRRPEDAPFMDELKEAAAKNPRIKLISTMAEMEKSSKTWEGERGFITGEMLKKYLPDLHAPTYYIAGPPAMVASMNTMLKDLGVKENRILLDEFLGY